MACVTYAVHNAAMCKRKAIVCAFPGMRVVKSPSFPEGEESGRVGTGVGVVVWDDTKLGNLKVYWDDDGDYTCWTRASSHGFDVVTEVCVR